MTSAEIIGTIVGVLSLIVAYIALKKDHYSKPTEELDSLKLHFNITKTLSENVQQRLQHYIEVYNAADNYIFSGVTFEKYLQLMKANYDESFTEGRYQQLDSLGLTKPVIASMTQSLQTQFTNLQQVETLLKTLE